MAKQWLSDARLQNACVRWDTEVVRPASGRGVGTGPSQSGPNVTRGLRMHRWNNPRSFAFPLVEGSTGFLVTNDPAGSQPAARRSDVALLSAPLQNGVGFLQRSVAPHLLSLPCG